MLNRLLFVLLGIISITLISCSPKNSEIIVAQFGDYDITIQEFEKAYSKNVGNAERAKDDSIQNYEKFLDLYVNFKMKLRDSEVRQLNKDAAILNELNDYKKRIGSSYLIEKDLYTKGIKDLYQKRSEELRVSHLLIRTDSLSDAEAKQKASDILGRINSGSSFEDEVRKYSDDQFSKNKGGDIYYLTAGMIMPAFEDAAFNTPVGSVNQTPLKTQYGYHIIKVTDRRPRIPLVQASHILIAKSGKGENSDNETKLEFANQILERIKAGEDFEKLAGEYSEDPGSKAQNGNLGYFARRQMVQPFDYAAFNLKIGEVSDIVETQFGYHIIKVLDNTEYPDFESEKKSLRDLYEKTRKEIDYDNLITEYSKEVKLVMHDEVLKTVTSNSSYKFDESYWESDIHKNNGNNVLFTIGGLKYTTDSLISFAMNNPKIFGQQANENKIIELLNEYKNEKVLEYKAESLVHDDKQFADLMEEYKNGIMIFRLQEDEVWNRMKMDSTEMVKFYEKNKENYVWPNRVQYAELFTTSDSLAERYLQMLKDGAGFDSIAAKYSEKPKTKNPSKDGLIDAKTNELSKVAYQLNKEGDYSDKIKDINGWSIVKLIKKEDARIKTYEEARTEVASAYQDLESKQLEEGYISRLENIYKPELFYDKLENAYKN